MKRQKEIIKTSLKFLKNIFFAVVAGIALYMGIAVLFSYLPTHPPQQNCQPKHEIFVASNGIHLDIILPVKNVKPELIQKLDVLPGTMFISFGWGDKEFYIKTPEWSDLTFPVAFRALFLKSETAMHVTYLSQTFQSGKKIQLCANQLNILNNFIENSFIKDEQGNLQKMDFEGYSRYDEFYDAKGSFSLFRTCNVWVNNALKEIGIETSVWSPFDFGVLHHIKSGQ